MHITQLISFVFFHILFQVYQNTMLYIFIYTCHSSNCWMHIVSPYFGNSQLFSTFYLCHLVFIDLPLLFAFYDSHSISMDM